VAEIEKLARSINKGLNFRYTDEEVKQNIRKKIYEKIEKGEYVTPYELNTLDNEKVDK